MSGSQYIYNIVFDYRNAPTLERFSNSDKRIRAVVGPFRSGKSSACCFELYTRATQQNPDSKGVRRTRWAVVRNTYPELKDTTIKTFLDWFPPEYFGHFRLNPNPEYQMNFPLPDGTTLQAEFLFRALDKPEHVKNLLSLEVTGAWFNEAREIPKIIIDTMDGRINQYPAMKDGGATWGGMILDTNPCDTDHWFYKLFCEDLPNNLALQDHYEYFHQPSGRSPRAENLSHLPKNYYQDFMVGKDADFISVYVDGQYGFVREGKVIYTNYLDSAHCATEILKGRAGLPLITGWDFGLCYSADTEVLTIDGWKFFKDVDEKRDLVATRNPESGMMEYTKINFKIERDYEGELLEWSNQNVNFCVTPEHRVPFTFRDTPNRVVFGSAEWLAQNPGGHHYVDLVSSWNVLPTSKKYLAGMCAKDYARFMGIYLAEGSSDTWRTTIYQKYRESDIEEILVKTDLPWKWNSDKKTSGWRLNKTSIAKELKKLGTAKSKRIPREIKDMPSDCILAFILTYTMGDGNIRVRENGAFEHTIFTVSPNMADDFQELAQKIGWYASIRKVKPQESTIIEDGLPRKIKNNGGFSITFKKGAKRAELFSRDFLRVPYSGKIYCLNVPYHTLYIRRNGIASWNGNTPACVIMQYEPKGRLNVLHELCASEMGIRSLATNVVKPFILATYPGFQIISGCDPAGTHRSEIDENLTAIIELKNCGFSVKPAWTNALEARFSTIDNFLTRRIEGDKPAFQLSPECKVLRKGFNGEYKRRRLQVAGAEIYSDAPEKNMVSHPHEALQYAAMIIERGMRSYEKTGWNTQGAAKTNPPSKLAWA